MLSHMSIKSIPHFTINLWMICDDMSSNLQKKLFSKKFEPTLLNLHNHNFYVFDSFFLFWFLYFCGLFKLVLPPPKHSDVHHPIRWHTRRWQSAWYMGRAVQHTLRRPAWKTRNAQNNTPATLTQQHTRMMTDTPSIGDVTMNARLLTPLITDGWCHTICGYQLNTMPISTLRLDTLPQIPVQGV
jgi:hypothetical protein